MKGKLEKDKYTQIAHDVATARSSLGESQAPTIYTPTHPLEGNQSLRLTPMLLANTKGFHPALDFRITYHDITDNDRGYLKGAQIEFMKTLVYYDTAHQGKTLSSLKIYEMNILSVASLGMMSKFFKPFSYRFNTGFNRTFVGDKLSYYLSLGGGVAYEFNHYLYGYYLLEPTFFLNPLRVSQADFVLNNVLGMVLQNNKRFKLTIEYQAKNYDFHRIYHYADMTLSLNLFRNFALFGRAQLQSIYPSTTLEDTYMTGLRMYF